MRRKSLYDCPICGQSGHPLHWACFQVCPLYEFKRGKLHFHIFCHLCKCEWCKFPNGVLIKVKVHFLQYKLIGMPPSEKIEYANEQTRDTIAGKLHMSLGGLTEGVKVWTEERDVAGSSSSERSVPVPSSGARTDTTEKPPPAEPPDPWKLPDSGASRSGYNDRE